MGYSSTDGPFGKGVGSFNNTPTTEADFDKVIELLARGVNYRVGTTAQRTAVTGAALYNMALWGDTDTDTVYFYDSGWVPLVRAGGAYTPTWTSSGTAPTLGNSTLTGSYSQVGKHVHGVILFTIGTSGVSGGTGVWRFSLPFTPAATMGVAAGIVLNNGVGRAPLAGEIPASTAYVTNIVTAAQTVEAMSLSASSVIRLAFDFDLP